MLVNYAPKMFLLEATNTIIIPEEIEVPNDSESSEETDEEEEIEFVIPEPYESEEMQ
jgi:hypothetical protein